MDSGGGTSWPLWARLALVVLPRATALAQGLPPQAVALTQNIPYVLAATSDAASAPPAVEHPEEPSLASISSTPSGWAASEAGRRELCRRRYILALYRSIHRISRQSEAAAASARALTAERVQGAAEVVARARPAGFAWALPPPGVVAALAAQRAQQQQQQQQYHTGFSPQHSTSPTGGIRTTQFNPLASRTAALRMHQQQPQGLPSPEPPQKGFFPINTPGPAAPMSSLGGRLPPQQRLLSTAHGGAHRPNPLWARNGDEATGPTPAAPGASLAPLNPLMLRALLSARSTTNQ